MPKALTKSEAQHLANLMDEIPKPSVEHIAKVKIAAIECRNTKEFCKFLDVDSVVFKHWVNTNIEFRKAYRSWRDHATEEVEMALAKKAIGFTKRTRKQILTRQGSIETLVSEEYFPPDSAAAGMWLKNRNGKEWKDTQQIDINVQTNIRAWLVTAMEDAPQDDSEIIDVTPQLIEQEPSSAEQETFTEPETEISGDTQEIFITAIETDVEIEARDIGYDPSPGIAALNAKWS